MRTHERRIAELRQLLAAVRRRQRGGAKPTAEEAQAVQRAHRERQAAAKKRSLQLNQRCSGEARCTCEACGPLGGDAKGFVHCFHCQCESYPKMTCEFDPSTLKEKKSSGWFF